MKNIDIYRDEHQFKKITFSCVDSIKGLIKFRSEIDQYRNISRNDNIFKAGNPTSINEELICLYIDLDHLIDRCKFTKNQLTVIELLMDGWSEEDISDTFKKDVSQIYKTLDVICKKIKKEYLLMWKYDYIYLNVLPVEWDYKKCAKCEEFKPMTGDFFRLRSDNKGDGFRGECRTCE